MKPATPVRHYMKEWRRARGLSQAALAERLGYTQAAISQYENGRRVLSLDVQAAVADALGIPPIALLRAPQTESIDDRLDGLTDYERAQVAAIVDAYLSSRSKK